MSARSRRRHRRTSRKRNPFLLALVVLGAVVSLVVGLRQLVVWWQAERVAASITSVGGRP